MENEEWNQLRNDPEARKYYIWRAIFAYAFIIIIALGCYKIWQWILFV